MIKFLFFSVILVGHLYGQNATSVYNKVSKSTVTIETNEGSLGSGFFIAENIIVTNYHVIEGATQANCYLINSNISYSIEGYLAVDKNADLILLKVSNLNKPPIKLSLSNDVIGQKVFVIGSPKGLPGTISDGIISAFRDTDGTRLIQMTAPISSGSSGGPVLNSLGELIGISVSQIVEGQNLNFAIPKSYLELLIKYKRSYSEPIRNLIEKLKIGDEYAGGIIFYLDASGKHGKVMSKNDIGDLTWFEADSNCKNLILNGYDDWYLPSIQELTQIYSVKEIIGPFSTQFYWSSTLYDVYPATNCAWRISLFSGTTEFYKRGGKDYYALLVRAVRNF